MSEDTKNLEQRLTALEAKVEEEVDRLYNENGELAQYDTKINELRKLVHETSDRALEASRGAKVYVDAKIVELNAIGNAKMHEAANAVIARQPGDIISKALAAAIAEAVVASLTAVVLKTRPATREEMRQEQKS